MRISKQNPPRRIHAICADFDLPLTPERVNEAIEKMRLKPSWVERSLGGNCRLVWILALPLLVDSTEFAQFVLQESKKWLQMELLPGLDDGALCDPMRLLCNGQEWSAASSEISDNEVQAFYVKCGQAFRFAPITAAGEIPLDLVEKALKEKFPTFSWPGPFDVDTQGPSFWVEGSTSPMSAIVKKDGMFSFSDHAEKPFFYWGDILGKEFAAAYETNALAEATKNIFFDGKMYWALNVHEGHFIAMSKDALQTRLKVECRVSPKPDKTSTSMMDRCLNHINNFGHVSGGAPVLFHAPGLLEFAGTKIVNTASKSKIVMPSGDTAQTWGAEGKFPFLSQVFDGLFDPTAQLEYFLAWLRHFYINALRQTPKPGQNIFIAGGAGVGKTLTNRMIIGGLMGGHADAARFMVGDGGFNSSLFHSAVWSVDDETITDSESAHRRFSSYIKLAAANQSFSYRKKFEHDLVIPWQGRVIVTLNLDDASSRSLPALDGTILDKVSFFRGVAEPKFRFPDRDVIVRLVRDEMPHFAQWLVNWETPEHLVGEARYGVKAFHEPSLINRAHQSSKAAPFKEIVVDFLVKWFGDNPKAAEYRGSVTQLMRALHSDPLNDAVMRSLKLEQCNRYLETLSKEGVLSCKSENGDRKTRVWVFPRFGETLPPTPAPGLPPMTNCSIFTR